MRTQEQQFQEALEDDENCPEDCSFLQITKQSHPYGETSVTETLCECICEIASECPRVK